MHSNNRVTVIFIIYALEFRASGHYGLPVEVQRWDAGRTPLDLMVDATNQFGLKVLDEHNFLNQNNVAFSPYGLTGILVALYEGVEGDSSFQIQRSVELPWNRNVMRIGFRDIHRTLKTYFIPEEGFLAGLALNNENVTFKEGYKEVLQFYGFDFAVDQMTKFPPKEDKTTTAIAPNNDEPSTISNKEETTAGPPPMPPAGASNGESQGPISVAPISPILQSAGSTTVAAEAETVTTESTVKEESLAPPTLLPTTPETSPEVVSTNGPNTNIAQESIPPASSTVSALPEASTMPTTPFEATTSSIASDVEILSTDSPITPAAAETSTAKPSETPAPPPAPPSPAPTESPADASASIMMPSATEAAMENSSSTGESADTASMMTPTVVPELTSTSTLETLQRRKKSIFDFIMDPSTRYEEYLYERPFDLSAGSAPTFSGEKMFLANGLRRVEVAYMMYDTVLEYTYLPHFKASAIKLPLDNDHYYLLVILPDYEFELNSLIKRLARESNLRDVYSSLQHRYVRACVPSFMVKGFVTLTTDLQRLGIRDVFEPRQNDFSPMTAQKGVYVRNVEQAITVTIRKYEKITPQKSRYMMNQRPIHFSATYPFIYFVMDSSIHVSLMAGKVMDPLNTRVI